MSLDPSVVNPRPTKLLDLPNELLSRVIHFTVPAVPICPAPQSVPLDATNIAFTCKTLYHLVKQRLSTFDFLSPASPVTHVTKVPRPSAAAIEKFTKLASPFLEVLRLPINFEPTADDMSAMGCCRNLKQLCIPISYDISEEGAANFLLPLKKLVKLTIINPRTPVFEVLTMAPWTLRELNIISVTATAANRRILEDLLKTGTLESLMVTFNCFGMVPNITPYNCDDPHYSRSVPETLQFLSKMLKRNSGSLQSLRKLAVATNDKVPRKRAHQGDGKDVHRMVEEVNALRRIIDRARAYAVDHPVQLNLTEVHLQMYAEGKPALEKFMKGLVSVSTEMVVTFENLVVSYPGTVKEGVSPRPVVTDLKLFFDGEHWELMQNVDFRPRSVTIVRKESAAMVMRERSRPFLTQALQESVESIRMSYLVETGEEMRAMMGVLHYITGFTPCATLLALPVSIIANSELISVADLQNIKCADNVRVLWLDFSSSVDLQPDPLGMVYLDDASLDFYGEKDVAITARLPDFLCKVRRAFPKLRHIFCERTHVLVGVAADKIRRAVDAVKEFEEDSGIDASSLRQEIRHWAQRERPEVQDMERLRAGFEKLGAYSEARERAIAATNSDRTSVEGSSSDQML